MVHERNKIQVFWAAIFLLSFATFTTLIFFNTASLAQDDTNGGTTAESEDEVPPPSRSCAGAEVVETVSGSGDQTSSQFTITGGRFVVGYTPESAGITIDVRDENDDYVSTVIENPEVFDEGPGEFFLEIDAFDEGDNYEVTVQDCTEEAGDSPSDDPSDDDGDDVINVPDKDLPKTGGLPLLGILFSVVAGAGLLTAVVRRRS